MTTKKLIQLIRYAAAGCNILFILWVLFNAMDEPGTATLIEKLSAIALICLLATNSVFLMAGQQKQLANKTQKAN